MLCRPVTPGAREMLNNAQTSLSSVKSYEPLSSNRYVHSILKSSGDRAEVSTFCVCLVSGVLF